MYLRVDRLHGATEELGHIEVVAATINGLLTGAADRGEATDAPLKSVAGMGNPHHFLNGAQGAHRGRVEKMLDIPNILERDDSGGEEVQLAEKPQVHALGYHPGELAEIAQRLMKDA
jgi:Manganese containing catalase